MGELWSINVLIHTTYQETNKIEQKEHCALFKIKYSTLDNNPCVFMNLVCVSVQVWWRSRRGSWRRSSWTCRAKQWPESHLPGSLTSSRWLSSPQRKSLSMHGALTTLLTPDADWARCSVRRSLECFSCGQTAGWSRPSPWRPTTRNWCSICASPTDERLDLSATLTASLWCM